MGWLATDTAKVDMLKAARSTVAEPLCAMFYFAEKDPRKKEKT